MDELTDIYIYIYIYISEFELFPDLVKSGQSWS
ncbi:MAG: hypothetical protein ACI90V_011606, partial [Bacillariaceae sp.]